MADLAIAYTVFLHLDDETLNNIINNLSKNTEKYLLIGEILGREWRRPGNPPVFNRNIEDYIEIASQQGFEFVKEYRRPYKRYSENFEFKDKNTDFSFLLFKLKA